MKSRKKNGNSFRMMRIKKVFFYFIFSINMKRFFLFTLLKWMNIAHVCHWLLLKSNFEKNWFFLFFLIFVFLNFEFLFSNDKDNLLNWFIFYIVEWIWKKNKINEEKKRKYLKSKCILEKRKFNFFNFSKNIF